MNNITQEELKELFDYNPELGLLIRRDSRYKAVKAETSTYRFIRVNGKKLLMHRAIWCWHHGEWPKQIDHKDGNRLNNRIENLRPCSQQQNLQNRAKSKSSKTKYKGVICRPAGSRGNRETAYEVLIGGKYGGYHKTEVEAALAYDRLAIEMYGEFARLNFPQGETE